MRGLIHALGTPLESVDPIWWRACGRRKGRRRQETEMEKG